jgi:hypothetical protein
MLGFIAAELAVGIVANLASGGIEAFVKKAIEMGKWFATKWGKIKYDQDKNGVPEVSIELDPIHISLIAPTRAGKTTLLSTVMKDAETALTAPFKVRAKSREDEIRVGNLNEKIARAIGEGTLIDEAIKGGAEITEYNYEIVYEHTHEIAPSGKKPAEQLRFTVTQPFNLMDIPGGWLDVEKHPEGEWQRFTAHLHKSVALWVPIDAPILMESRDMDGQIGGIREGILKIARVQDIVVNEWAKYRTFWREQWEQHRALGQGQEEHEPAAVLCLAPLKCETYFSQAENPDVKYAFKAEFIKRYGALVDAVKDKCAFSEIYYTPVESIGCIKLQGVEWNADSGNPAVSYKIVNPPRRISGADALTAGVYRYGADCIAEAVDRQKKKLEDELKAPFPALAVLVNLFGKGKKEQLRAMNEVLDTLQKASATLQSLADRAKNAGKL